MPCLDIEARQRVIILRQAGYSVADIRKHLEEENIVVSLQALFNLLRKHKETGKLMDLPRRARPRKLSSEMMVFLNQAMAVDDELTARQAHCLLAERWPTLQVSLPTIKRVCKYLGWV